MTFESGEDYLPNFMSKEEEKAYFDDICARIIANPRFYLDNLDRLYVFRIGFMALKKRRFKVIE